MEKEKKLQKIFEKDCILIPRQAMGKLSDNDILAPIFSILPLFYTKNRENSIILTLNEMFEHLFITDQFFLKNIIKINKKEDWTLYAQSSFFVILRLPL